MKQQSTIFSKNQFQMLQELNETHEIQSTP